MRILNIGGDFLISITQLIGGTRPLFPGVDTNNHNFVSVVLSDLLCSLVTIYRRQFNYFYSSVYRFAVIYETTSV